MQIIVDNPLHPKNNVFPTDKTDAGIDNELKAFVAKALVLMVVTEYELLLYINVDGKKMLPIIFVEATTSTVRGIVLDVTA